MAVRGFSKKQSLKSSSNNKAQKLNKIFSVLLILVLSLILLWDIAGPYGLWKLYHLRHERDIVFTTNIKLDKKNQVLKNTISLLKSNRKFQERWIRKNLGWVKNNELLFVFISKNGE